MKNLLAILLLFIIFSGCSQKNAFKRFHLSSSQELAEDNLQSTKVVNKNNEVIAIVTALHLNKIDPKRYNKYEYFYIYIYDKNRNEKVNFYLNGMPALLQEELPVQNEFTKLTSVHSKWNRYYLLGFTKQQKNLNLKIQFEESAATLLFKQY